jgi:peptide/nickel transport system permease protein
MNLMLPLPPETTAIGWRLRVKRFRRHRGATLSALGFVALILFSLAGRPLAGVLGIDPEATDLLSRYEPPSTLHWLGTDDAGRDELIRLMLGGQMSLFIGITAAFLSSLVGLLIGLAAGYFRGKLDILLMRLTDGVISLPLLPLLIVLGAVDLTKLGLSAEFAHSTAAVTWRLVLMISLVQWTSLARVARAGTLVVKERDFVRWAWASGARPLHVLGAHILPNIANSVTVTVTLSIGQVILFESALSFLGFGVIPPTPSWGNMLSNAQELVTVAPALAIYPGLMIFVTVIIVNLLGEGIQHALDPNAGH